MINSCYKGWNDPEHNQEGRCCCNCEYQHPVNAHPWNKGFGQGSVMEIIGWICAAPEFHPHVTFFEFQHSMCECHEERDYEKYSKDRTLEALKK